MIPMFDADFMANKKFYDKFQDFLIRNDLGGYIPFMESFVSCDSDKFRQYLPLCKNHNIPLDEGLMVYLVSKCPPYSSIAREQMPITEFLVKYHKIMFPEILNNHKETSSNVETERSIPDIVGEIKNRLSFFVPSGTDDELDSYEYEHFVFHYNDRKAEKGLFELLDEILDKENKN